MTAHQAPGQQPSLWQLSIVAICFSMTTHFLPKQENHPAKTAAEVSCGTEDTAFAQPFELGMDQTYRHPNMDFAIRMTIPLPELGASIDLIEYNFVLGRLVGIYGQNPTSFSFIVPDGRWRQGIFNNQLLPFELKRSGSRMYARWVD